MGDKSNIEWTDATWNPIRARNKATGGIGHFCEILTAGCSNCYAQRMQPRFGNDIRYNKADRDKVDIYLDERTLTQPLRWTRPRVIFPCSMTDIFGEWVSDEWLGKIFDQMMLANQHIYQVLTKRADRMHDFVTRRKGLRPPFTNHIWLGVSAEDQKTADERIPPLLQTPTAVRWVSAEPLLGDILFDAFTLYDDEMGVRLIDWVVVGGESGPNGRPFYLQYARNIVDQCQAVGVRVFVKQLGRLPVDEGGKILQLGSAKGNDMTEWPDALRIREMPEVTQ